MGFEASHVARRRLAAMASRNGRVQDALSSPFLTGFSGAQSSEDSSDRDSAWPSTSSAGSQALAQHLDVLAQDIVSIPGAGGALLAAFAAQARALAMVVEAAKRGGNAPLPQAVLLAAQDALAAPSPMPNLVIG